ncbi:hypothetical protein HanXRQr2_Chr14g0640921 [Helianthus annuus]|uniref:Uncharacterized protein n=1 Tax=Helianthus annuus TaxID=4232 RepID=A0A251SKD5_HELAN|nr:hypothetical protein HanXRQr2_Chr14g0640921 [Helianthus annuus]KAJ0840072.1 hypothetical protein HanPSC8_Chr14g0614371 [Helianthus annuus]
MIHTEYMNMTRSNERCVFYGRPEKYGSTQSIPINSVKAGQRGQTEARGIRLRLYNRLSIYIIYSCCRLFIY